MGRECEEGGGEWVKREGNVCGEGRGECEEGGGVCVEREGECEEGEESG